MSPFENPPDFVNAEGVKWWRDTVTTEYANRESKSGLGLNVECFFIETSTGYRTRVLIDRETKEIVAEDQKLEGMGIKIDLLKVFRK